MVECDKKDCLNRVYTGKCQSCGEDKLNYDPLNLNDVDNTKEGE
jgi:hypothetical protein